MIVCGIDIQGRDVILAIVEATGAGVALVPLERPKISTENEDDPAQLRTLKTALERVFREYNVERIVIKGRPKIGTRSGGGASFKLETVVQLNESCTSSVVMHPATAKSALKKKSIVPPGNLYKYCHDAFLVACALAVKEGGQ